MVVVMDLAMVPVRFHMVMMAFVPVGQGLKVFSSLSLAVDGVRRRVLAMALSRGRQHTSNTCDSRPGAGCRRDLVRGDTLLDTSLCLP